MLQEEIINLDDSVEDKELLEENKTRIDLTEIIGIVKQMEVKFLEIAKYYRSVKVTEDFVSYIDSHGDKQILDTEMPSTLTHIYNLMILMVTRLQRFRFVSNEEVSRVNKLPTWLMALIDCIKSNEPNICNSSIEGLIFIISDKREHEIFKKLKFILHQNAEYDKQMTSDTDCTSITELVIDKLWELLDYSNFHKMAINMLNEMNQFVPETLAKSIQKTLEAKNYTKKEKAFQRFSTFWRLTTDSEEYRLKSSEINKLGLFMMLEFVDDQNPLLRHAAKN